MPRSIIVVYFPYVGVGGNELCSIDHITGHMLFLVMLLWPSSFLLATSHCIFFQPEMETDYWGKPEEIYDIIEHFCLGRRRLHLFGNDTTIRPGTLRILAQSIQ